MTTWRVVCGSSTGIAFDRDLVRFQALWGSLENVESVEINAQFRFRLDGGHTATLANLLVRATSNNLDAASTIESQVNAIDGNQSVSFAAGESGVKEDTVNTDVLVDGDRANTRTTTGAGAHGDLLVLTLISYTLEDTAGSPQSFEGAYGDFFIVDSTTRLLTIHGNVEGAAPADEAFARYTVQVAATAEKLRIFVSGGNVTGPSTFDFQINQVDTALDLVIPTSSTGEFEETVDTVSVSVGDVIRYNLVTGGDMGSLTIKTTQVRMDSPRRHLASQNAGATSTIQRPFGITCFGALEEGGEGNDAGDTPFWNTTESAAQITARIAMEVENLFVRISLNDLNGATTVALRVNGSNSALSVSIGSSATGTFEDTVDTIDIVDTDTVNYILDTSTPTSGNITLVACGVATGQAVVAEGPEVIHSRSLEAFSRP